MNHEEEHLYLAVKELQAFVEQYGGAYYGGQLRILKRIIAMLEEPDDFPEIMDFIRRDYEYFCDSRCGISEFIVWKDDANERIRINRRITELDHLIRYILWNKVYDENGMLVSERGIGK